MSFDAGWEAWGYGLSNGLLAWKPFFVAWVFVALGVMALGFLWKDRRAHLVRALGWALFALYWPFQAPEYFWPTYSSEPDPINGWFTLLGPLFLLYVARHEVKSYQWNEDPPALRWFIGASVVTALTYFVIAEIPGVATWLIQETAEQSAWLYNAVFFGGADRAFVVFNGDSEICLPEGATNMACRGAAGSYAVTVILACTAIQSIMIFVGAIACLTAPSRAKLYGYLITVPTIYVLNLFRNAGIVYGTYDLQWGMFGMSPFEWMHSWVGKVGSLVAMVIIALALFATLPQLHHNILDLFDLRRRTKPGFFEKRPPPPPTKIEAAAPAEG